MKHSSTHPTTTLLLAALALSVTAALAPAAVIYTDNFNIAGPVGLDGSDQTGRHTGLVAADVVLRSGGIVHNVNGGLLNILIPGSQFGRVRFQSAAALPTNTLWNFAAGPAGAQILADGGFRFEFDWTPPNNTTDDWVCLNLGINYLDQPLGVVHPSTDFGILLRNNGVIDTFDNSVSSSNGSTFDVTTVAPRHAAIDFTFTAFADGSLVTATTSVNGISVGAPVVFDWNGNAGVINLEMAANNIIKPVDNIAISSLPEPTSAGLLGLAALVAAGRRRRRA